MRMPGIFLRELPGGINELTACRIPEGISREFSGAFTGGEFSEELQAES